MLSRQEEELERRAVLENDRRVREQQKRQSEGTTFHQHAQAQADETNQGRFAATGVPNVIGPTPIPKYPAASSSWQIQLPDEPPLGFDNPALDELENVTGVLAPGAPAGATESSEIPPWRDRSSDNGAPLSQKDDDNA
jgi:hypothetical protein